MVEAGAYMFGSAGRVVIMASGVFGRLCSGSIQKASFINGDRQNYRTSLEESEKGMATPNSLIHRMRFTIGRGEQSCYRTTWRLILRQKEMAE